ncbi:MAG: homocysteine S-methyltransferase family protein [Clostridia bacterium]|nr:homocysteine S-methyltransferase family protein [Clostridia bacterium]
MNTLIDKKFVILDGAMGTMLQKKGLKTGEKPEIFAFDAPDAVMDVHRLYIESGSDIIYANTFGANRLKMAGTGKSVEEIILHNVSLAKKAADKRALVALDIGPVGEMLEPAGELKFEEAYDIFKEEVIAGNKAGCDLIVIETMTDLAEARAATLAAKENSLLPVVVTMSFEKNGRTFTGCTPSSAAIALSALGVDAVGINCSLGPEEIYPIAREMSLFTRLPLVVKANAGLPDPESGAYNISAEDFAKVMKKYAQIGVRYVGGCCGTNPEYIKRLKAEFESLDFKKGEATDESVVCTAGKTVVIDSVKVIGERINPTGKKVMREALKNNDMDYILATAVSETEAGSDILDINVGAPGINEAEMMAKCVKAVQSVTDLPLQIDSTMPEAIEAGLRVFNGKAIVNSVNGEDKVLDSILPIVKKYGASVVGLTLDDNGIPDNWQGRVEIAEKILKKAQEYGIDKKDVFIDTLTLTVSTEQKGMYETLRALRYVKEEMGLKTVLGVSNISFGLPKRQTVNCAFLTLALEYGLTMPILNPNDEAMMGAVYAYGALTGSDKGCNLYTAKMQSAAPEVKKETEVESIESAILKGLCGEAARKCEELVKEKAELSIVNEHLIPALDIAGEKYEKGEFFLPQLLGAANAAKEAFDVIKKSIDKKGADSVKKGKIILATVKGDIHDIGKNIVKVILENYGYQVIDLGKDVKAEDVLECAKREKAGLIGLSALMTTTLKSMEETVRLIRESGLDVKIMCGGAVLTKEYAVSIGADYYAKDAKEAADVAKEAFST